MRSRIHLSEHFTYSKLMRFTLPSIMMNIFAYIYIVVDGYFVANFAGKTEFAAINLIMPVLNILGTIDYMFGVGGSALIAKTLGEKKQEQIIQNENKWIHENIDKRGAFLWAINITISTFRKPIPALQD